MKCNWRRRKCTDATETLSVFAFRRQFNNSTGAEAFGRQQRRCDKERFGGKPKNDFKQLARVFSSKGTARAHIAGGTKGRIPLLLLDTCS